MKWMEEGKERKKWTMQGIVGENQGLEGWLLTMPGENGVDYSTVCPHILLLQDVSTWFAAAMKGLGRDSGGLLQNWSGAWTIDGSHALGQ